MIPDIPTTQQTVLLTDSRSLSDPENTLFFALVTQMDDGHRYIRQLYDRGVRRFVVSRPVDADAFPGAEFYCVSDTLEALQSLGAERRAQALIPVVAITGSRGKTMVKELLYSLLQPDYRIARSPRSYNSQIGVPLSLWDITPESTLGIFEAGVSRPGEMDRLSRMIKPDAVIITNILNDHDEGFPSREAKVAEKVRLIHGARAVIYPADDKLIAHAVKSQAIGEQKLLGWSRTDRSADLFVSTDSRNGETRVTYMLRDRQPRRITLPFTGAWQVENAISALAALLLLEIPSSVIAQRMATLRPIGTRLQVSEGVNRCLIVRDDYTCDFYSLLPALDFMARRVTGDITMTVVLSDIAHDGMSAEEAYAETARLLRFRGVKRLLAGGPEISAHAHLFRGLDCTFFPTVHEMYKAMTTSDFASELVLIKGTPADVFDNFASQLEARTHETVLEVNLDALVSNYNFYRAHLKPTTGIVAMVKASGYGAGSFELAKSLQAHGAAYLAVAVLDEGVDLRRAGITMPIMVLNPKVLNYPQLFENRLEPEVFDFDILSEIIDAAMKAGVKGYPVHLKLDTGMHRLGFREEDLDRVIEIISNQDAIRVCSVFSHLATADCLDMDEYTEAQLQLFERCSKKIQRAFPYRVMRHILNTAGILRYPQYQYDMVRLGIGLYGIPILNNGMEDGLRPVSRLRSVIIALKSYPAGTAIGYGRRGLLERDSLIATVPVGYADGINRHLGCGHGKFLVNGMLCPTVGNICMDVCMVDVTDSQLPAIGDPVEIFGPENPVTNIAEVLDTIPYEVLTSVSPRVRRIYYRES